MNWIDLVILIIMGYAVIRSLTRGLVREVFEVVGMIASIFLAYQYYEQAGEYLSETLGFPVNLSNVVGFAAVVIGVAVGAGVLGFIISKSLRFTPISLADRLGGVGFGLAKGFLLVCIFVVLIASMPFSFTYTSLEGSYLGRRVMELVPRVYGELESVFPDNFPRWELPESDKLPERI